MLRILTLTFALAGAASAAVWPPAIGRAHLVSQAPATPAADRSLWDEYGLLDATRADYGTFRATAYFFRDATGATAAAEWIAAGNPVVVTNANCAIACEGRCPDRRTLAALQLPGSRPSTPPLLPGYLPSSSRVRGSERYALGPVALARFAPEIPVSAAAFQFGTEVQLADYDSAGSKQRLVLLNFPAPQMARPAAAELAKVSGAAVKRTGPLVAVVLNAPGPAAADQLLSQVHYQASISWDEPPKPKVTAQGVAKMVLAGIELAGILMALCLGGGALFAFWRLTRRRSGPQGAQDAMITLRLVDR